MNGALGTAGMQALAVVVGGGLGSLLRFVVQRAGAALLGATPPATLAINVVGSFVMGLCATWFAATATKALSKTSTPPPSLELWRLFVLTGVLGGFTTFSAFSLDAATLAEKSGTLIAGVYVVGSVVGALVAAGVGIAAARAMG